MTTDKPFDPEAFRESVDAAAGALKRMAAVTAQLALTRIPADAACCCLCPVYEPHLCEGWRADGVVREVPSKTLFGKPVPVCRTCHAAKIREA